ncbi:uncharacterized protein LOC116179280 isoform X1 [Photinus pyralis]|uniref:uncharacterized protein LOC116179280 isoform X1 n=1 Tax=Photinus pyralis TaxID=7054 RepID=UPI0012672AE6|nr:uncharacterized protein LOC116179280 isoform X1 [Photinus pyralis]
MQPKLTQLQELRRLSDQRRPRPLKPKVYVNVLEEEFRLLLKSKKKRYGKLMSLFTCKRRQRPMTREEVHYKIQQLNRCCLSHIDDSYKIHISRHKGIQTLNEIIDKSDSSDLSRTQIVALVWSSISCLHHFYIRLRIRDRGCMAWVKRNQARKSIRSYDRVIQFCLPYAFDIVLNAIITFFTESNMWSTEYLCSQLLKRFLYITKEGVVTVHSLLDIAEKTSTTNVMSARQVIRVLYQVLKRYPWYDMDDSLMRRLLTMYHHSIVPTDSAFDYVQLRTGIEVMLRHVLMNIPNDGLLKVIKIMIKWITVQEIPDDALLYFSDLIEYTAKLHKINLYRDSLEGELFMMVLELIGSKNRLYSLLGNRVLQHLMDRHRNVQHFSTPRIFFGNLSYDIAIGRYNSEDKAFVRLYRQLIHNSLLNSIKLHGSSRINIECTYASIAILIVEVPCSYIATVIVCLTMGIQETAITTTDIGLAVSHHMHATVIALISLVCWVHDAHIFYDYVIAIMTIRAKNAPHLNPPLRTSYPYAQDHVLWNKPEMFFVDWEVRYCLWKCFRPRLRNGGL